MTGLAYDLKRVSRQVIQQKVKRNDKLESYSMPNALTEWLFGLLINTWPLWAVYLIRRSLYYYLSFTNNPNNIIFM